MDLKNDGLKKKLNVWYESFEGKIERITVLNHISFTESKFFFCLPNTLLIVGIAKLKVYQDTIIKLKTAQAMSKNLLRKYFQNNFFRTRKITCLRFLSMFYKKVLSIRFNRKNNKKIRESNILID